MPLDAFPHTQFGISLGRFRHRHTIGAERDAHAALRDSRDWRSGVAMGLWSNTMEARILRPLVWFGLLESRTRARLATEFVDPRLYRKAPLFDRFVKFDVQIEGSDIPH